MATTSSIKIIALMLQASLIGLCAGAIAYAQSNKSEPALGRYTRVSFALPTEYQRWLDQDVRWIINPEEAAAFIRLPNNEDRDRFVEQFWLRRDPTPGTAENEYKEEHYRRIAYSNVHFAAGNPGWKTDRGRIYIVYGPPDQIKVQRALGSGESARPAEVWHYQSISGYGRDVEFKFVDVCECGDYQLQPPSKN
jgi:GWxTD domain-containing protein